MDFAEQMETYNRLHKAFSPSAPIDSKALFAGRLEQINKIIDSLHTRGQHIAIFGERGVGKTSLVNVFAQVMSSSNDFMTVKINCDETDTFRTLWEKAFTRISMAVRKPALGIKKQDKIELANVLDMIGGDSAKISPFHVTSILGQIRPSVIVIFDEFDRIVDKKATKLMADTIKSLSDESVPATVVVVGVANDVSALIEGHLSIERALRQILMPRMSNTELEEIIDKGLAEIPMQIQPTAKKTIAEMSKGLPHYTHLLALNAAKNCVARRRTVITSEDVSQAIRASIADAQESTSKAHHLATMSPRKESLYQEVLLACALAETDDRGYFTASAVKRPLSKILGKTYEIPSFARHLTEFCDVKRGHLLERTGTRRNYRFRFANPLMQPYVIFHGISNDIISEDNVNSLSGLIKGKI